MWFYHIRCDHTLAFDTLYKTLTTIFIPINALMSSHLASIITTVQLVIFHINNAIQVEKLKKKNTFSITLAQPHTQINLIIQNQELVFIFRNVRVSEFVKNQEKKLGFFK